MKEEKVNKKDVKYTWDLTHIYKDKNEFLEDFAKLKELKEHIWTFKGRLRNCHTQTVAEFLEKCIEAENLEQKLEAYILLNLSTDYSNVSINELSEQYSAFASKAAINEAFIRPELIQNIAKVRKLATDHPEYHYYKNLAQYLAFEKKHTLSQEKEDIFERLTQNRSYQTQYNLITQEMYFEKAENKRGQLKKVTNTNIIKHLESEDRTLRKNAYIAFNEAYKRSNMSIANNYITFLKNLKDDLQFHNYDGIWQATFKADENFTKVISSLCSVTKKSLHIPNEYKLLKRQLSKQRANYMPWDVSLKVFDVKEEYDFESAKQIAKKALSVLGDEYIQKLDDVFEKRYIDVFPKEKKEDGAFNLDMPFVHPYLLLNYQDRIDDVSTLCHESGHAMHGIYAQQSIQKNTHYDYSIQVAEVASTVNELLLYNYIIENEEDLVKKAYYLGEQIETIIGTLVTQMMYTLFELDVVKAIDKEKPVTYDYLNKVAAKYSEMFRLKLPEKEMEKFRRRKKKGKLTEKEWERVRDLKKYNYSKYWWSKIPHFYRPFYVYKYASGISASICIVQNIEKDGQKYVQEYLKMLKSGGIYKDIETLKIAKVDLEAKETYENAYAYLEKKIDMYKQVIEKLQEQKKIKKFKTF